MSYEWVIRNATVFSNGDLMNADLAIQDGKIAELGSVTGSGHQEMDASHLTILPGAIDTQVHFREPGLTHKEDLESGSRSAVCGGVTSVLEMPNTKPTTTSREALEEKLGLARGRMWTNYGFFIGATSENAEQLAEWENLPGTPGVKIFMGSSTGPLLVSSDEDLRRVLRSGRRPCAIHAEDEPRLTVRKSLFFEGLDVTAHNYLRDSEAAVIASRRIIQLSEETSRPVHILHISTGDEVELIRKAKAKGDRITCEVTPQHLFFEAPDAYKKLKSYAQMNPPIREAYHRESLWHGLNEGIFDVFGSDHAPHTKEEKLRPYRLGHDGSPSGMPGVQTILPMVLRWVLEGQLSLAKVVRMLSERPAELYGMKNKGKIEIGFDADLVLCDLNQINGQTLDSKDLQYKCGWSAFEGEKIANWPKSVFVNGQLAAQDGEPYGTQNGTAILYDWK